MIIQFEDETYSVHFEKYRVANRNCYNCWVRKLNGELGEAYGLGEAIQNPRDSYRRSVGRQVSLNRALVELGMPHDKRSKFIKLVEGLCKEGGKTKAKTTVAPGPVPDPVLTKCVVEPDTMVCHI